MVLRVGLIGAGANTADRHVPGFRALPGVEVVGLVNRSEESSRRAAEALGVGRVFATPEALCADPGVDAVCIGTWPYKHREYTIMALEAGKHVLCEARMAMDLAEAEEMLAASERHPGLVAQLVPAPFDFTLGPTITRLIAGGAIGEVTEVTVRLLNGAALDPATPVHWRQRTVYSGRNVGMFGIFVEIIERWLGPHAGAVTAAGSIVVGQRPDPAAGGTAAVDVPDVYVASGLLKRGARVTYHLSGAAAGATGNGIVVYGTKGSIAWRMGDSADLVEVGGPPMPIAADPGTARGWQVEADFVASVRDGAPVRLTNFEDGVAYMRVVDAAHRSWTEGRRVLM